MRVATVATEAALRAFQESWIFSDCRPGPCVALQHGSLVPTLRVVTHYLDAPRQMLLPQSGTTLRYHAERGNEQTSERGLGFRLVERLSLG